MKLTKDEREILLQAARTAVAFGTGIATACQEQLEDYGYVWMDAHEEYVFKHFIEGSDCYAQRTRREIPEIV